MAGMHGKVTLNGLQNFQKKMEQLSKKESSQFTEAALKELAARLLARVIKRTPVGKYGREETYTVSRGKNKGQTRTRVVGANGKVGGYLRLGWTAGEKIDPVTFANTLNVTKEGNMYTIEIINPVEYAPYVEFGHRTTNGGWVDGRFMLTISETELQKDAPTILMNKLNKFVKDNFNS